VYPTGPRRADHHGQLGLVLDLLRLRGKADLIVRADDRRGRLEEQQRLGRHLVAQLSGVLGVVSADTHHLARQNRREQPNIGHGPPLASEAHLTERMAVDLSDCQSVISAFNSPE
jgi:hypothetical protein